jgi:Tfp pilus assembly protein PilN
MANLFSKKQSSEINLLPDTEFAGTVTGRILAWIISTFRVIVIATEILVMIAFLSRFWLDAQNTDLNEQLDQKKAILSASLDFEHQFKDTQKRLRIFTAITNGKTESSYIKLVSDQIPPDVSLQTMNKLEDSIEIQGTTASEQSAQQFVANLQAADGFSDVSLTNIISDQLNPGLLSFTVKTVLKGEQTQ